MPAIEDKETVEAWKNDLDTLLVFVCLHYLYHLTVIH